LKETLRIERADSQTVVSNVYVMFSGHGTSIRSDLHATFPTNQIEKEFVKMHQ
jgi:hypothetical protein